MDHKTKSAIESFVWNATVGLGGDPEEISNEPDEDVVSALAVTLHGVHGVLSNEEQDCLVSEWTRHFFMMTSP